MAVKSGYKQTEAGVIPTDWEVKSMATLFSFQNGVNADGTAYGSGVPFINVLEVITHSTLTLCRIPGRVTLSEKALQSFAVQHGDILFNRTSETQEEVGLASVYGGTQKVVFGGFVIRARPIGDHLDMGFASYALRSPAIRSQIVARGQGVVRANIGQNDLSKVYVFLPTLAEQEAIAEALSDADALIESLEQLLTKKRHIKQGAMQELLTGKKRLPGFEKKKGYKQTEVGLIPGDWDFCRLGEDIKLLSGHHVLAQYCNIDEKGVAYLTGPADFPDGVFRQTKYTTRPTTICAANDILVTVKGSGAGTVVVADSTYCISRQLMAVRVQAWSESYVYYSLLRESSVFGAAATGLIPGLSRADILETLIPIPRTPVEQNSIATVLSDMDEEIIALESKLEKARQIKQGMMQELLTGRIRLV